MPEPTRFTKAKGTLGGDELNKPAPVVSAEIIEPRCHVCVSPYRRAIDRMLALGTSFSEISRVFGDGEIDRRSIANHDKKHLSYEDAAVRRIIDHEIAEAQGNLEDGIQGAVTRRIYLNAALHKALESLLAGDTTVEPKDALGIIQLLEKLDQQAGGAASEQIQLQFNAFVLAIRELAPALFPAILARTKEIVGVKQLDA